MIKQLKGSTLLIATNNKNKQKEIKYYLQGKNIQLLFLSDINQQFQEPEENSNTFFGNAFIKAKYYGVLTGYPALADDSGLCVDELNGLPGIYSSRWAGKSQNYIEAISKIEKELIAKDIKKDSCEAKFACSLALYWDDNNCFDFYGEVKGNLNLVGKGMNGFGYDPFFIPKGHSKTFAQMSDDEKRGLSHRSEAFKKLLNYYF